MSFYVQRTLSRYSFRRGDFDNPHKFDLDIANALNGSYNSVNSIKRKIDASSDSIHFLIEDEEYSHGQFNSLDFSLNKKSSKFNRFNRRINRGGN